MNEDEGLLEEMRKAVADFLRAEADPARRRTAMDSDDGYDRSLFERGVTELGLGGLTVPEACGGLGLGFAEAAVVIEEFGRAVVPSPVPDTLVAATVLAEAGEPAQEVLHRLATDPVAIAVAGVAGPVGVDGGRLHGTARAVPHGARADLVLVLGADGGVYLVSPADPGVTRTARWALDHTRRLADVEFSHVPAQRLARGGDLARRLVDLVRIAIAVESAAAASACLEQTVAYLKVREQFGRPIGSFQALKHRCADMAVAVHGALATARYAVRCAASGAATDSSGDDVATVAAVAKTVCTDTLMSVAADCLQLHGGVGFTFEHDLHLYLKRGKANQVLAGRNAQLRATFAAKL
ncbi:acyl-CoA dehydrogenase family protein [Amycolatopsis viridis]|uniref:Alkylation response protein AidB-like acyl-CoA dehydrogenase n=1 Tax=Amycolatopsis viridis TaxID=185678 RepID=A0ABX0SZR6_9PSEU|nr:acyl-CoA dehydrogenase family protein [Amycolatopsis viridis]NIH80796.1 alkylation response protein AidB-like acyl-CoA dehydrogenase [Amycolatopsis viridis]